LFATVEGEDGFLMKRLVAAPLETEPLEFDREKMKKWLKGKTV